MGDDAADGDGEEKVGFWEMKFEDYLTEYVYNGRNPPTRRRAWTRRWRNGRRAKYKAMLDRLNTGSDVVYGRKIPRKNHRKNHPLPMWAEMTARRRSWTRFRSRDHRSTGVQISGRFT